MAAFLIAMSVVLYSIFLAAQTLTHSSIFQQNPSPRGGSSSTEEQVGNHNFATKTAIVHATGLIAALLPTVWLSKRFALYVDFGIGTLGAPLAFGGFLIAALILAPKVLSAIRTARSNPLRRPINIYLSSALSTIGLTIPTVLIVGWVIGVPVELGLEPTEIAVLAMTLIVSLVTFIGRRTYMLQGAVHLALFVAYVILVFD